VTAPVPARDGTATKVRALDRQRRETMMADVKKGDKVSWGSHGGTAHGTVEKTVTSDVTIKGNKIKASKEDPKVVVKTDSGAKAAHKPGTLKKG
jgi:preprotein translocase subunit YajC